MSLPNEIIGGVVVVEGVEKLASDASLLTKGIAAIARFKGVEAVTEHMDRTEAEDKAQLDPAA